MFAALTYKVHQIPGISDFKCNKGVTKAQAHEELSTILAKFEGMSGQPLVDAFAAEAMRRLPRIRRTRHVQATSPLRVALASGEVLAEDATLSAQGLLPEAEVRMSRVEKHCPFLMQSRWNVLGL